MRKPDRPRGWSDTTWEPLPLELPLGPPPQAGRLVPGKGPAESSISSEDDEPRTQRVIVIDLV